MTNWSWSRLSPELSCTMTKISRVSVSDMNKSRPGSTTMVLKSKRPLFITMMVRDLWLGPRTRCRETDGNGTSPIWDGAITLEYQAPPTAWRLLPVQRTMCIVCQHPITTRFAMMRKKMSGYFSMCSTITTEINGPTSTTLSGLGEMERETPGTSGTRFTTSGSLGQTVQTTIRLHTEAEVES